ncbi:anti-sigma factor [Kaistia dalseonensis]|uniref:Anti-sigma factor RsiW n=1 Tax=Kaistia dalseonensis TaxID=410840 RepID=A0ABU0H9E0_9HYPH|nr:anti-sigma factor [Kaistia dalseonensis]MCX5495877.1 anti-sigma factor [Kaistia dalseonensis]MDQ0438478.1 anti-sigma factor RsiW [Kaistia dalseonensis]
MTRPIDPITDADLNAYVDDQLGVSRRIEVEAHLSRHANLASRVMADLRARDELRLTMADMPPHPPAKTMDAARRLERGLSRDRLMGRFRRVAAVAALVAAGWLAHAEIGPLGIGPVVASSLPPAYLDDAVMAHRTSLVRAGMHSQHETTDFDPNEIRASTAIVMPALPKDWHVRDVQIFPSQFGPSVEIAVDAGDLGPLSLFAVRPGAFDVVPVTVMPRDDASAAYWQIGDVAYALVAKAETRDIERAANRMARSLY